AYECSVTTRRSYDLKKLRLYFGGGQSVEHEYLEGSFREYDQGNLRDSVPDGDNIKWRREVNTTGMFHGQYKFNDNNKLSLNSFRSEEHTSELQSREN